MLTDMNERQIARLDASQIAVFNRVFREHRDALDYFGYDLMDGEAGDADQQAGKRVSWLPLRGPRHLEGSDVAVLPAELHANQMHRPAQVPVLVRISSIFDLGQRPP